MTDEVFNRIWEEKFSQICMSVDDCECCPVSEECAENALRHLAYGSKYRGVLR